MARRYWIYRDEARTDVIEECGYFHYPGKADAVVNALEVETGDEYYRTQYEDDEI